MHEAIFRARPNQFTLHLELEGQPVVAAMAARGHVRELMEWAKEPGWEAALLFVVQGDEVEGVAADEAIDPEFARALRDAHEAGVTILARACALGESGITWGQRVEVMLGAR